MPGLPDDETLRKLLATMGRAEIAKQYGVSPQAVSYRRGLFNENLKGRNARLNRLLPWDLSEHPKRREFMDQYSFRGLRAYMRERNGEELGGSARSDRKSFVNHIRGGEVIALDLELGFIYVPRESRDDSLVVRWPSDVPLPKESADLALFVYEQKVGLD
ncbi:hypothetical protein [Streptomyces buecherae]|uniref:hypothetical protein n=1 Tax=Streptomyces buecherae TaxID=2763006 RepID=UPI0037A8B5CF